MQTPVALPAGTWRFDPTATTITVSAKKLGLFSVPAELTMTSGQVEIDGNSQVVSVAIVADASSYNSKSAKRNEHVVGSDFLDAGAHPTIAFRATNVAESSDQFRTTGTVTVKGQSAPVDVVISDVAFNDGSGSFTATATIDRNDIGLDRMPTFLIGRDLPLVVSAKLQRVDGESSRGL